MAEEIQEAVQIIRVAYDGIEIAMKVGSGGIAAMQKAIDFLKGMLDYEKSLGKTSMRKLLLKGGDLQVLQFKTEDMRKVERMAKKYGILYSVLPDCNKTDGMSEVIFHTEAVPRVNMMIQKLKFGRIATFDDYLKNGDEKSLGKLMDFLRKQQGNEKSHTVEGDKVNSAIDGLIEKVGMFAMEKQAISVDQVKENFSINGEQAENVIKQLETIGVLGGRSEDGTHKVMMDKEAFTNRIRGYQSLADRMRAISASKNTNLSDVTISKKLIAEENDHAVKTRVPGTWGKDVRYVWLHKDNVMDIHNGKTMLTFLDTRKDYKLYDEQNRVVTTKKGDELYTHYDKVESSVRERYEKVEKEQKKTIEDTKEKIYRECEMLAEGYRNIYENAVKENALYELSTIQKSMDYFGKYGYAVIDSYNQLDMVQSIKVDDFLKKAEKEKNGKTTIFQVIAGDYFIRYDLKRCVR